MTLVVDLVKSRSKVSWRSLRVAGSGRNKAAPNGS